MFSEKIILAAEQIFQAFLEKKKLSQRTKKYLIENNVTVWKCELKISVLQNLY